MLSTASRFYLFNVFAFILFISSCTDKTAIYVCPPCNMSCDELSFTKTGICPHCKMTLVLKKELLAEQQATVGDIEIDTGSGLFKISGGTKHQSDVITVHYYKPMSYTDSSRILIVIPGAGRNGDSYRDGWISTAELHSILILSPQYEESEYPFEDYHLGGLIQNLNLNKALSYVENSNQVKLEESKLEFNINTNSTAWIFNDFDRIFELVQEKLSNKSQRYDIFGHSAGGQILHRMALFHHRDRINKIIASNSGFYTLPDTSIAMPFGLNGMDITDNHLKKAFSTHLVLLIGELDNEYEQRGTLLRSYHADIQGMGRLSRAKYFYNYSKKEAEQLNTKFNWQLHTIPGVGHNQSKMALAASDILYHND